MSEVSPKNSAQAILFRDNWYSTKKLMEVLAFATKSDLTIRENRFTVFGQLNYAICNFGTIKRRIPENESYVIESYGIWPKLLHNLRNLLKYYHNFSVDNLDVIVEMRINLAKGQDVWDVKKIENHS